MGRIVFGGYQQDVNLILEDRYVRAVQNAAVRHLMGHAGFFIRYAGSIGSDRAVRNMWVGQGSALRFEYEDVEFLPAVDVKLAASYARQLEQVGGIVLVPGEDEQLDADGKLTGANPQ